MKQKLPLRDYQIECIDTIYKNHNNGINKQLISLPTGSGKTIIFSSIINSWSKPALVLCNSRELLQQTREKLLMLNDMLDVGLVDGDHKEYAAMDVVVATIQSAMQEETLAQLCSRNFKLLVVDESHHVRADSYNKVLYALGFDKNINKSRLLLGFTATPFRNDGRALGETFEVVAYKKDIKELIAAGYLVQPIAHKIVADIDFASVDVNKDESFKESSLRKVMDTPEMNNVIVQEWLKNANNLPTIAFTIDVDHAKNLAVAFQAAGIKCLPVYASLPKRERDNAISAYRSGDITVITNCDILTEGFDEPKTACVIIKPTRSTISYRQQLGRALRLAPNKKHAIILDFNDKTHSICDLGILQSDDVVQKHSRESATGHGIQIPSDLPPKLKQALLIKQVTLSDIFLWKSKHDGSHVLSGGNGINVEIAPKNNGRFDVLFYNKTDQEVIAYDISFEYAFSAADNFVKHNRKLFAIADLEAPWRLNPISEKQLETIQKKGYRSGIHQLTRGQAATIIEMLTNR